MQSAGRARARVVSLGIATLAIAACSRDVPVAPRTDASRQSPTQSTLASVAASRTLIAVRDGHSSAAIAARIRALGGTVSRTHGGAGIVLATGLSDAARQSLAIDANVADVLKDRVVQWVAPTTFQGGVIKGHAPPAPPAIQPPDDQSGAFFFAAFQWNMRVIRASDVWKLSDGHGYGATVCDLDTGIDPTHIDLAGKVDIGMSTSVVASEPDIIDYNGHGTFVSSQIATNGIGMASVAPLATLCQVKVLDKTGGGLISDAIAGVIYAADAKADVINMSFGGVFSTKDPNDRLAMQFFQRAVNYAHSRGVTLVASAGNGDANGVGIDLATIPNSIQVIPAQLSNVISVGATAPHAQAAGTFDTRASYSNYGWPGVDVFAPGGDFVDGSVAQDLIIGACSSFARPDCADHISYLLGAGTSFAAPHVSGEAAIVESDTRGTHATLDACIIHSSDPLGERAPDPIYGFGRIDVLKAIHCRQ